MEFYDFLVAHESYKHMIRDILNGNRSLLPVDLDDVKRFDRGLYESVMNCEDACLDESLRRYMSENFSDADTEISVAFYNTERYSLRELRSDKLNKLVSFKGTVTRTTQVRPELQSGVFECGECRARVIVLQQHRYTEPVSCPSHLCQNRTKFSLLSGESKFVNWQKLHVQEVNEEIPLGALPRHIDVVVRDELVETVRAGDTLVFTGRLAVVPDVVQMTIPRNKAVPLLSGEKASLNVKSLDCKYMFMATYHDGYRPGLPARDAGADCEAPTALPTQRLAGLCSADLYNMLSQSLFPNIHGYQSIKNAILLMLVGGVTKRKEENVRLRGDINILLVGDPGTAKSQFLKQASAVLERSVYTSGKSSSAAGLTSAVLRDAETGEFTIEVGALVIADNGLCCIDEFDKMSYKDQVSIHETMEQQTITIAKAGIHATLNAKCSILAAANPVHGRYDKRKSLRQNINLTQPLMSRFDLFFVLIDDVDYDGDFNISTRVLENHCGRSSACYSAEQVRRYIRDVRNLSPVVDEEAHAVLIKYYVRLRQNSLLQTQNYRLTVRQLESMIRLSEALAKVHRDAVVRPEYVEEAYRLIKSSVIEIARDDLTFKVGEAQTVSIRGKDYERITSVFVYVIKTRKHTSKDELVAQYLEEIEETIPNEQAFYREKKLAEDTLFYLINKEGVFYESGDAVLIHPNFDV